MSDPEEDEPFQSAQPLQDYSNLKGDLDSDVGGVVDAPFQSAQIPQDQIYATQELESDNDQLSNAPSLDEDPSVEPIATDLGFPVDSPADSAHDDQKLSDSHSEPPEPATSRSRPNKYRGPPSTWRNWTAPERDLAASLDQLTAKDLSVHLYNAFKLKRRGRKSSLDEDDEIVNSNWEPPAVWTAWPLAPDIVPRNDEGKDWEEGIEWGRSLRGRTGKPSEALGELLVAHVLRKARQRYQERESENSDCEILESQSRTTNTSSPTTREKNFKPYRPVLMADDERAEHILQPTTQHIMMKLDELLIGLHHARSSYLTKDEDSASKTQSQARGRSKSQRKVKKRKRSTVTNDTESELDSDPSERTESGGRSASRFTSRSKSQAKTSRSASRMRHRRSIQARKQRLGLRDWSDVLGVAAMTDWEPSIVEKAAARCADLFGGGMTFRTFHEGREAIVERTILPGAAVPATAITKGDSGNIDQGPESEGSEEEMVGGVHVDGFLQPIKGKKARKYSIRKLKGGNTSAKGRE